MRKGASVIIRAFNSERYIGEALKSIIDQDYDGIITTVICYDEGSNDKTLDVILSFQEAAPPNRPVKLVRHTHLTPFRALQKCGFENVDDEYIFLLDYDNYYPLNYIREVINGAEKYNASFVFTRVKVVDKYGQELGWLTNIPQNPYDRCELIKGNYIDASGIMLRRDCLGIVKKLLLKIDSPYYDWLHEDWLVSLLAIKHCKPLYVERHVYYRIHETNITAGIQTLPKHMFSIERSIKTLLAFYEIEKGSLSEREINTLKKSITNHLLSYMSSSYKYINQKVLSLGLAKLISLEVLRRLFSYIRYKT